MQVTDGQSQWQSWSLPPLAQILISGLGLLVSLSLSAVLFLVGILNLVNGDLSAQDTLPMFNMGWMTLLVAGLLIPSFLFAARNLRKREISSSGKIKLFELSLVGLIFWVPLLLLGNWISNQPGVIWLLLPPIQLLLVAIPLIFLVEIGRRKLVPYKSGRDWGVFSFGVVITHPVVLAVEIVIMIFVGLVAFLWIISQPQIMNTINQMLEQLMNAQVDPGAIEQMLLPYLARPDVLFIILAVAAGLIPLAEETLKTLPLWLMLGQKFVPAEGFVVGLLAGATFALLESLSVLSTAVGGAWAGSIVGRLGTGILHTTTGGLMGLGLSIAWNNKKYLQLGLIFLGAVTLHGVWNFFGLLMGLAASLQPGSLLGSLGNLAPYILGFLALVLLTIVVSSNRLLRLRASDDISTDAVVGTVSRQ
jgi:hypothetical protein